MYALTCLNTNDGAVAAPPVPPCHSTWGFPKVYTKRVIRRGIRSGSRRDATDDGGGVGVYYLNYLTMTPPPPHKRKG